MSRTRRVVTMDGAGRIAVAEEPVPDLGDGTVLVEVRSCLISPGTELAGVRYRREKPEPARRPSRLGYGSAGVVVEVGPGCRDVTAGLRVACMGAGYALHASHAVVPVNLTLPVPEGQSFEEAAFAHLAGTALHAVRRADLQFGHNVAVLGLGIIGQLAGQLARACGAHVMGVDRLALRLGLARRCRLDLAVDAAGEDPVARAGQFTRGHGIDAGIIAFGGPADDAIAQLCKMLKVAPDGHRMGCIVIVGGASFAAEFPTAFGNVDIRASSRPGPGYHDEAWEHGRDYPPVFVPWTTRRNLEECLRFAAEGRLLLSPLITHRFPLSRAIDAFDAACNKARSGAIKVIVECQS